jgi:hypothetical protein
LSGEALTNLDHEVVEVEGVVPLQDSTNVTDNLSHASEDHSSHETPALPSPTKVGMDDTNEGEESGKDDVGRERGAVLEDAVLDVADIEGTVGLGAKGLVATGEELRHGEGGLGDGRVEREERVPDREMS